MNAVEQLIDFDHLKHCLQLDYDEFEWQAWLESARPLCAQKCNAQRFGDLNGWLDTLKTLPLNAHDEYDFTQDAVKIGANEASNPELKKHLLALKPWRKGPFNIGGVFVDTEWQSNKKWSRLAAHIDLTQKRILDVGCGNGYYALRMLGAGAKHVLGVDPSPRFLVQYAAMRKGLKKHPAFHLLPLGIEDMPQSMPWFDVVFSMGVFYHRRSPFDHLIELKNKLRPGGTLVLETLVIEGGEQAVLVPKDRYAMMRNVWFLPSCDALMAWVDRAGFAQPKIVDVSDTGLDEQRATEFMTFQSLEDFLDPNDHSKTVEGYPAPKRAVLVAQIP